MISNGGRIHRRKSSKDDDDHTTDVIPTLVVNVDDGLRGSTSSSSTPPSSPSPIPTRRAPPPPSSPRSPLSPRSLHAPTSSLTTSNLPTRTRVQSTPGLSGHSRSMSTSMSIMVPPPPGQSGIANANATGSAGLAPSGGGSFRFGGQALRTPHSASGPFRTSISSPQSLSGHSRTRSISTPYSPPLPSPLSFSFPTSSQHQQQQNPKSTVVDLNHEPNQAQNANHSRRHSRLHSRNLSIFFPRPGSLPSNTINEDGSQELEFPASSPSDIEALPIPSAGSSVSFPGQRQSAKSLQTPLGANFTFGGRPPSANGLPAPPLMSTSNGPSSASSTSSRRGHHHKHSLSHNFFSFLEPGSNTNGVGHEQDLESELYTQPTPTPMSPWNPISPFPQSANGMNPPRMSHSKSASSSYAHFPPTPTFPPPPSSAASVSVSAPISDPSPNIASHPFAQTLALPFTLFQFLLGSFLWVSGQQIGSLGTTGLGYWVVFDALGVGVGVGMRRWFGEQRSKAGGGESVLRRPYGNARIETVLQFAQSVYLMFASVYVCKETVEHVLLSAGSDAHHHHHHHGDHEEDIIIDGVHGLLAGIEFPYVLASIAFCSIIFSALVFNNHANLVEVTGNRIPSLPSLIQSLFSYFKSITNWSPSSSSNSTNSRPYSSPTSTVGTILSNPYVLFPLMICVAIWCGGLELGLDVSHHRTFDLLLAGLITVITFRVSYDASVVLGTVLLQTAPKRIGRGSPVLGGGLVGGGLVGGGEGRIEKFLRAMKDISRHPQVIHLPAPHIWQFTPTPVGSQVGSLTQTQTAGRTMAREHMVVTLELHVRRDLADEDVLRLTSWAWEKVVRALTGVASSGGLNGVGGSVLGGGEGEGGVKADVTVGIVRG
ncbi:hypothetical protein EV361DRAFT_1006146 [Lentinula raphanica]|nr:hypothetical protein EV361DRAFT_1006146 [Lentinula raphanica]